MLPIMDFKTASSRATETCITLSDIAAACGVADNTIRRARMNPSSSNYRPVAPGWEPAIAKLARERAGELVRLSEELEEG